MNSTMSLASPLNCRCCVDDVSRYSGVFTGQRTKQFIKTLHAPVFLCMKFAHRLLFRYSTLFLPSQMEAEHINWHQYDRLNSDVSFMHNPNFLSTNMHYFYEWVVFFYYLNIEILDDSTYLHYTLHILTPLSLILLWFFYKSERNIQHYLLNVIYNTSLKEIIWFTQSVKSGFSFMSNVKLKCKLWCVALQFIHYN